MFYSIYNRQVEIAEKSKYTVEGACQNTFIIKRNYQIIIIILYYIISDQIQHS